ncbi:uncharacterized protein LOC131666151 [Phymastichus coffea]|uniref:uncharacterized protein LOC131666151 n=1 Tax=Phymastichus coffea TaxID=108790 RepID=UPI00273C18B9|nr:uncharacterized protein LOC131666151 [Phymastichus coffea]
MSVLCVAALLLISSYVARAKLDPNPDIELKTNELATKYGYPFEEHGIITDDGYILGLHRIPFGRYNYDDYSTASGRPAVLLMHGLGGSSADWILMGPGNSLAYFLADTGYDVWLGNNRGNIYSRNHTSMEPTDRYFWDFSYHELGMYDLPSSIDYIIGATGHRRVLYVGHSQGTTQLLVMASQRPQYNDKIALAAGLAPAAFTGYLRGPVAQLTKLTYFGVWVGENFGYPEFGSRSRWGKFVSRLFCQSAAPTQIFCSTKFYLLAGFSPDIDLDKFTVIVGHIPAGASWKQLIHYGQGYINPGYFRLYDYGDGKRNYQEYGSPVPPEYKLEAITAPIALFSSTNDWLATPKDVELLTNKLRSIIYHQKITANPFNHYDFLWGRTAPRIVFEPLMRLMEKYRHHTPSPIDENDDFVFDGSALENIWKDLNLTELEHVLRQGHPHAKLSVPQIIELYGYRSEVYKVETSDKYILELHRITGNSKSPMPDGKPVVLLQHGLLSSSYDWVIAGPGRGFGFMLADAGYDVWMGNVRGNLHSREHKHMTTNQAEYWKFSWHELGTFDLRDMIDYILYKTGQKKIYYAGHSQGTTMFFVMASEHPEYNDKIHAMFALAPVSYSSHMFSPICQVLSKFVNQLDVIAKWIGVNEFKPTNEFFTKFSVKACEENSILAPICRNVLFMIGGFNKQQFDMKLLPAVLAHVPAGAGVRQFVHYAQLIKSGYFRKYDYGLFGNLKQYGKISPPSYNLNNLRAPIALHYSLNDWLSHAKDVEKLYSGLPNPIGKFRVPDDKFTHLDYIWGKDANTLLYLKIMSLMKRYKD